MHETNANGETVDESNKDRHEIARAHDAPKADGVTVLGRPKNGKNPATASHLQKKGGQSALVLALLNDERVVPLAVEAIVGALKANQMFYDKFAKAWEAEPDGRTRLAAASLVLQYFEGLPLQRIQSHVVSTNAEPAGLGVMLERSPAMREEMRRVLDAAERKAAS